MEALDYYIENTNRRLTIEYILLKDVNDHKEDAKQLAELLNDKKGRLYVNLIPYNPVDEHSQYQRSEEESVLSFYDILKKNGINCKIRQEHGTDIDAACGQLRSKQIKKSAIQ
jgi:23S rRNA (adenine2503-C2)-methyltransferase